MAPRSIVPTVAGDGSAPGGRSIDDERRSLCTHWRAPLTYGQHSQPDTAPRGSLETAMRILFASMPADGHFNPLTGIAAHLTLRGHDVRWYAGPEYGRKLQALGMTYFPYRRATEVTGGNINSLFPERAQPQRPKIDLVRRGQVLRRQCGQPLPRHRRDPYRIPVRCPRLRRRVVRREAGRRGPPTSPCSPSG